MMHGRKNIKILFLCYLTKFYRLYESTYINNDRKAHHDMMWHIWHKMCLPVPLDQRSSIVGNEFRRFYWPEQNFFQRKFV